MEAGLPAGAECLYSATEVDFAIDRVAVRLALRLWETHPVIVCLMTGGLPFTADLLRRFHFDLELDYMHLTRSADGQDGGTVRVLRDLQRPLAGRTVLLVDDVLDEGATLSCAQRVVSERQAATVLTAVMVRKEVPHVAKADFVALDAPDAFLVGRGMDCNGAFRQLSGIYRLPETATENAKANAGERA